MAWGLGLAVVVYVWSVAVYVRSEVRKVGSGVFSAPLGTDLQSGDRKQTSWKLMRRSWTITRKGGGICIAMGGLLGPIMTQAAPLWGHSWSGWKLRLVCDGHLCLFPRHWLFTNWQFTNSSPQLTLLNLPLHLHKAYELCFYCQFALSKLSFSSIRHQYKL